MSGETEKDVSGWTVDTSHTHLLALLRELEKMLDERYETQTKALDKAFVAQQLAMHTAMTASTEAINAALASAEKAVNKAEIASDKRFESVNEFRAQLSDQAGMFMPREVGDSQTRALSARISQLEQSSAGMSGRVAGMIVGATLLISVVVFIANFMAAR